MYKAVMSTVHNISVSFTVMSLVKCKSGKCLLHNCWLILSTFSEFHLHMLIMSL